MYRFSLNSFLPIFGRALNCSTAQATADVKRRIDLINEALQNNLFEYVSRSLFKADRLMFSLHLVHLMKPELFQPKVSLFLHLITYLLGMGSVHRSSG